jgi:HK97 family phage major capsid protein
LSVSLLKGKKMSIQALRERLQASNKAANHLLAEKGSQVWTPEDQATFDNHVSDGERCKAQIAAHEKMIAEDRDTNFTDKDDFRVKDRESKSEAKKGFNTWLRKDFKNMTAEEVASVRNTMSTTTGSQGGFTVQSDIASTMIDYLKAYGYMRAVASQITTEKGNPLSFPTSDGTAEVGEWIAQNVTATAADPVFGTLALNVFKASSKIVAVPFELLQDSQIDVEAMVLKRLADRIGRVANVGFTTGAGTSDPFGLVTQSSIGKTGTTGQTLTIIYDDLVDMVDSIDAAYLPMTTSNIELSGAEPGWMFSQTMRRVVRKIKDTAGRPIWMPSYDEGLTSKTPDRLLGFPVYINNDMAVPAANAKTLAFGNLSRYMIRDAMDVTMFRFDDSNYARLGQVGFLAWARMGGNLMDNQAVKVYAHSAT